MKFVMHNLKNISEFLKITDQYIELTLIEMSLKGKNQDWQASDEQARQIYMNPVELVQSHRFLLPLLPPKFLVFF